MTQTKNAQLAIISGKMISSLMSIAKERGVSLEGITVKNFSDFIDNTFDDASGEIRCMHFTDIANEYANYFHEFDSEIWNKHRWKAIESALKVLEDRFGMDSDMIIIEEDIPVDNIPTKPLTMKDQPLDYYSVQHGRKMIISDIERLKLDGYDLGEIIYYLNRIYK